MNGTNGIGEKEQVGKIFAGADPEDMEALKGIPSLGHYVLDMLTNEHSDSVLFVDAASDRQWTGARLAEAILNVATALIDEYQFEQGTVVCISHNNSDMCCILTLAVICAGGSVAASNPKDPYAELLYLARKVEPKFLFCHRANMHWGKQLEADLGFQVVTINMDYSYNETTIISTATNGDSRKNFSHLFNYDRKQSNSLHKLPVACKDPTRDVAMITMSSGTTGRPKAIPATHWNCLTGAFWNLSVGTLKKARGVKFACSASFDYVSGRLIMLGAIVAGYTAIILDGFEPKSYLEAIEKYRVNVCYLGAASFYSLITYNKLANYDISSLRVVFPMGAKIVYLDELREFFKKNPNIIQVKQGYGTSESSGVAFKKMTPDEYLLDCENCGTLAPGIKAKIVDPETGELLGPNQVGLLLIRSQTIFPGYYDAGRVKKTAGKVSNGSVSETDCSPFVNDSSIFDSDGFYITGDLGYFSENEELYCLGRQKELMSCRGAKKVVPQEIEEILSEHPAVSIVCVLGIPSKIQLTIHCPRAFIVVKPNYYTDNVIELSKQKETNATGDANGQTESGIARHDDDLSALEHRGEHKLCGLPIATRRLIAEDIMKFSNEKIGWEKQLTGGVVLLDAIPTLRTGKMDKTYLRSLSFNQVEIYGDRSGSQ